MKWTQKCVILPFDRYEMLLRGNKTNHEETKDDEKVKEENETENYKEDGSDIRNLGIQDNIDSQLKAPVLEGKGDAQKSSEVTEKPNLKPPPGLPKARKRRRIDRKDKSSWKHQWVSL